jgi:threonine dehydrogenase-like Zn-dependent dehydrogenase
MQSMAGVLTGDRLIELQDIEVPDLEGTDCALLEVEANGVCQTDHEQYDGLFNRSGFVRYPVIPGHETIGHIRQIGSKDRQNWAVNVGDRVALNGIVYCGHCRSCRGGRTNFCEERFIYGFVSTALEPGLWGGFSQYMVLRPRTLLFGVPAELSCEDAVLFNPLGAGFDWTVRVGGTQPGDAVLIIGPGQRGLACVIAAVQAGASRVIVAGRSRSQWKLDLARTLGATDTIDIDRDDIVDGVRQITAGDMVDRAIDTTPVATQPMVDAIASVRPEGTVVLAGIKGSVGVPTLNPDLICDRAITIRGVFGVSEWAKQEALATLTRAEFPFHRFHTHTMPLRDIDLCLRILGREVQGEDALHMTVKPFG